MKHLKKYGILIILLFPLIVFADMGVPEIGTYRAEISNPNGALASNGGLLNYGTTGRVTYEYRNDSEIFCNFVIDGDDHNSYYVNLKDIISLDKNFDLNAKEVENINDELLITAIDGVAISTGPAYGYKKTEKVIPYLTKVKTQKSIEYSPWYYVEFEDVSGWINIIDKAAVSNAVNISNRTALSKKDTEIYDYNGNVIKKIEKNQKFNFGEIYYTSQWDGGQLFIYYDENYGFVNSDDFIFENDATTKININVNLWLYEEVKYHEEEVYDEEKMIYLTPIGTVFETKYVNDDYGLFYAYIENKDLTGWIACYIHDYDIDYDKEENIITINKKTENTGYENNNIDVTLPSDNEKHDSSVSQNDIKSKVYDLLVYCVLGAFIASCTSVVTIKLINKKNKIKN